MILHQLGIVLCRIYFGNHSNSLVYQPTIFLLQSTFKCFVS